LSFGLAVWMVFIVYLMLAWNGNFALLVLINTLLGLVSNSFGLMVGSLVTSDMKKAFDYGSMGMLPQIMFSGFFVPLVNIPFWIRWLHYPAFFVQCFKLLVLAEFSWPQDVSHAIGELSSKCRYTANGTKCPSAESGVLDPVAATGATDAGYKNVF